MTGEYGHAIVMAKLRHCAKFRCTEVLHRIVDGVHGREGKRETERDGEAGGVSGEKGGQKSERPSHPAARTRREKRGRKEEDETVARRWLKQEGQCAARPEAEARAGATGSDLVILSLAIPPRLSPSRYCSSALPRTIHSPLVHLAIKSEL